jgi:RNA recognition motif-containing protein
MSPNPQRSQPVQGADTLSGTLIPNKVFVGGLAEKTNEKDLREVFMPLADVREVKIITDRSLNSKSGEPRRYAFIEIQNIKDEKMVVEDVRRVLAHFGKNELELHGRRLNVGPAYKKANTFGAGFAPVFNGLASPMTNDQTAMDFYIQMMLLQQQKLAAQSQYPGFFMPPNVYSSPTFMMQPGSPGGVYSSVSLPSSPMGGMSQPQYSQPPMNLGSPSYDFRGQNPQSMGFNIPTANGNGGSQDHRVSADSILYRTQQGFVQSRDVQGTMRSNGYSNHHN